MIYNIDFLIAAIVILLLILWYFLGQKRAEDLNNQVFLFFAVLGVLDVIAEFFSTYCITSPESGFGIAAVFITTVFYLLQALLPFTFLCDLKLYPFMRDFIFVHDADEMAAAVRSHQIQRREIHFHVQKLFHQFSMLF